MGVPLLEHIVALLRKDGFTELCMTLGHMPEQITDYFGDGERFGVSIKYKIEDRPLGTAGGVRACADFAGGEDFLVISGDAACDFNLRYLAELPRGWRWPAATSSAATASRCNSTVRACHHTEGD